jgi:mevalonate kinase
VQIGVVPKRVQEFISELELTGASCKTCGAGAVSGDSSGVLLVLADSPPSALCQKYGYSLFEATCDTLGARLVEEAKNN